MRKIFSVLSVLLFSTAAAAKYNAPEGIRTRDDKNAVYLFWMLDEDKDSKLSLQEWLNRPISRDVRREERRLDKEGKGLSPEEQFKKMDGDEDGFVTQEDVSGFLKEYYRGY